MTDKKLNLLQWYCKNGYPIFPCEPGGKRPITTDGFYSATTDAAQIETWHNANPTANWGMRTGDANDGGAGVVVVDIDPRAGGDQTWESLRVDNPEAIETPTVRTGGGGVHYWFKYPSGVAIASKSGVIGPGVDHKANGGYVIVPPSKTDNNYKFELTPHDAPLQELPAWILAKINGKPPKVDISKIPESIAPGQRHEALITTAAKLRRAGLEVDEIKAALGALRDSRFDEEEPTSEADIEAVVKWFENKQEGFSPTDLGNARRFVAMFGDSVRFCHRWNRWLCWNGQRWAVDDSAGVYRLAHDLVASIYAEASAEPDEDRRRAIGKHALASEGRSRIDNMLLSASPYLSINPDELDSHPMLLNCENGIVDLSTGLLQPHDRKYFLTKMVPIAYDATAHCPKWEEFLRLVTGDDQPLIDFLQLAVGYSLTGKTDEHCLFFLYGPGKNGKTTFTETERRLFGDYSQRTNIEALMQVWGGHGDSASPSIAGLAGARFVYSSEMPEGRRLNESLVKDLTGGDALTARYLHANPFTFSPSHKLWVFGNYKPRIGGTDEGIWRRIRVIPFRVSIPDEIRRPMSEVLREFDEEMPGILAWAVVGCLLWQSGGLEMPAAVDQATREYRNEQDLTAQFIDQCCELHPTYKVDKDELYRAWRKWCDDNGEEAAKNRSKRWLTQQFTVRGHELGGNGNKDLLGARLKEVS